MGGIRESRIPRSDEAVRGFREAIDGYGSKWHVLEEAVAEYLKDVQLRASSGEQEYSLLDLCEELEYCRDYIQKNAPKGSDYSDHQYWQRRSNLCLTRALVWSGLLQVDMCRPLARSRNKLARVQGAEDDRKSYTRSARPAEVVRAKDAAEKLVAGLLARKK